MSEPIKNKSTLKSLPGGKDEIKKNARPLRAIVIGVQKTTAEAAAEMAGNEPVSRQMDKDPWALLLRDGHVVEPPYDPLLLSMLPENNSELGPVVETMEVNIDGFGHRIMEKPLPEEILKKPGVQKKIIEERTFLTNFFRNCTVNHNSFTAMRKITRRDKETVGSGYWELITNPKGVIKGIEWAPAYSIRVTPLDKEFVETHIPQIEIDTSGAPKITTTKRLVRFRKFLQIREGKKVWFKQLGDPRMLDWRDGKFKENLPVKHRANPMLHFKIESPRTPYGLPRFIGNLFSIFGSRAAEEINFTTLKNNNVPSFILAVSGGGQVTQGTIDRLTEFVEANIKGSDNYSKFLILEAEPIEDGALPGQSENVKISVTPLTSAQIQDAMFQDYDKNNMEKVRTSFRMPPIFIGRSRDYNRATADTSRALADEQIFAPERMDFDDVMNNQILPRLGVIFHTFRTNSPNVTINQDLVKMLAGSEKTGGLTPQIARNVMSDIFGTDLGKVTAIDPEIPFTMQVAEAVKNMAPVNQGTIAPIKSILDGGAVVSELLDLRMAIVMALQESEE